MGSRPLTKMEVNGVLTEDRSLWADACALFWKEQGKCTNETFDWQHEIFFPQPTAEITEDNVIQACFRLKKGKTKDSWETQVEMFQNLPPRRW